VALGTQPLGRNVSISRAEDAPKPGLTTAGSLRDALAKLGEGRDVEIVLSNGKSYRGKLATVGNDTVLLTQITGKEFYDVLIVLDEIAAVELRVRGS
jgi:hypothetical protein